MPALRTENRWYILAIIIFFISSDVHGKIIWKMGTVAPENSPWLDFWFKGVEAIEKEANGEIHIVTYTSLPEKSVIERLQSGEFQVGVITSEGTYLLLPELMVFSVPLLIRSDEEVDLIREKYLKLTKTIGRERGYEILAWFDQGFVYLVSTFEISSPEDFRKLRVGVWSPDPFISAYFSKLGAQVIYRGAWEIQEAFKKGEINATYCSPLVCVVTQVFTAAKFILNFRIRYEPAFIVTKTSTWNSIPENIRNVILRELNSRVPAVIKLTRWYHVRSFEEMLREGMKQIQLSAGLRSFLENVPLEEDVQKMPSLSVPLLDIRKVLGR